ncbi:hypothetical protein DSECCO2_321430 [anaerobic digester metagenome]
MTFCPDCGSPLPPGAESCPSCEGRVEPEPGSLVWSARMPVVTSPVVVKQLVIAFGVGALFVALLMVAMGALFALPWIAGIFLFLVVLALVIGWAIQFFTKGGPMGEFAITSEGVGYRAGKESKALNRATLVGSAIGGSLAGTGGSLINISREMESMHWDEVRSVTVDRRDRSLLFYRRTLVFPIVLYATDENFDEAVALVERYASHAVLKRKG